MTHSSVFDSWLFLPSFFMWFCEQRRGMKCQTRTTNKPPEDEWKDSRNCAQKFSMRQKMQANLEFSLHLNKNWFCFDFISPNNNVTVIYPILCLFSPYFQPFQLYLNLNDIEHGIELNFQHALFAINNIKCLILKSVCYFPPKPDGYRRRQQMFLFLCCISLFVVLLSFLTSESPLFRFYLRLADQCLNNWRMIVNE